MKAVSRRMGIAIAALAVTGVIVSGVSLQHHFAKSKTSFCNLGETLNCDIVNRSAYSKIMGIPVALIGVGGYLAVFALATVCQNRPDAPSMLFFGSLAGVLFALRLTYIEGYVLGVWCVMCLTSQVIIFLIFLLSTACFLQSRRSA